MKMYNKGMLDGLENAADAIVDLMKVKRIKGEQLRGVSLALPEIADLIEEAQENIEEGIRE